MGVSVINSGLTRAAQGLEPPKRLRLTRAPTQAPEGCAGVGPSRGVALSWSSDHIKVRGSLANGIEILAVVEVVTNGYQRSLTEVI